MEMEHLAQVLGWKRANFLRGNGRCYFPACIENQIMENLDKSYSMLYLIKGYLEAKYFKHYKRYQITTIVYFFTHRQKPSEDIRVILKSTETNCNL